MSFEAQLFEFTAKDCCEVDVVDESIDLLGAALLSQIWEAERCCTSKDSLSFTGSGSGSATGPSQHVVTFWRQSRQIVLPPTR